MNCDLCKSKTVRVLYKINKYCIYYCQSCSFVYVYPFLGEAFLKLIYQEFTENLFEKKSIILNDASRSLRFIKRKGEDKLKLLDIGCGNGIFLQEAEKYRWIPSGIDMSSKMVEYLKKHFTYPIFHGNILTTKLSNKYDLITLNQVVEHFSHPTQLIKKCYNLLNKDGYIYIATPNIASNVAKIRKSEFDYLIPPQHLSYFNKKTLDYILITSGFKVIKFHTWSYPVDLAGVIKYILGKHKKIDIANQINSRQSNIKSVKYLLFDKIICGLFYKMLNFNNGGTMIGVLAQKQ